MSATPRSRQTPLQRKLIRTAGYTNKKAAKLGRVGRITAEDLGELIIDAQSSCFYCGITMVPIDASFDHYVPFERGGENVPNNIVVCCMTCQRSKGAKLPGEYDEARAIKPRPCVVCGDAFTPRWADLKRGYGTTCSLACAGKKAKR